MLLLAAVRAWLVDPCGAAHRNAVEGRKDDGLPVSCVPAVVDEVRTLAENVACSIRHGLARSSVHRDPHQPQRSLSDPDGYPPRMRMPAAARAWRKAVLRHNDVGRTGLIDVDILEGA